MQTTGVAIPQIQFAVLFLQFFALVVMEKLSTKKSESDLN